ncbi:MAG TPA: hypothetical protein VLU92_09435 [Candidatus Dormibacteraeota bacterium]|nr:hypothetical protein [Candidatus Dormibacteraeota bacterium]
MERPLGAAAAVLTWLGWLTICPALGFPTLAPVAMVNRAIFANVQQAGRNPGYWFGWVVVITGLLVAVAVFLIFDRIGLMRARLLTGVFYGASVWLFSGVVIMPLLGLVQPSTPLPANFDSMHATLMMYSLGPLAAAAALIAWLLFGAILGATWSAAARSATAPVGAPAP